VHRDLIPRQVEKQSEAGNRSSIWVIEVFRFSYGRAGKPLSGGYSIRGSTPAFGGEGSGRFRFRPGLYEMCWFFYD
jgi:hypothetical protein